MKSRLYVIWMVILRLFQFAHQETWNNFRLANEDKDFLKYENSYILCVLWFNYNYFLICLVSKLI